MPIYFSGALPHILRYPMQAAMAILPTKALDTAERGYVVATGGAANSTEAPPQYTVTRHKDRQKSSKNTWIWLSFLAHLFPWCFWSTIAAAGSFVLQPLYVLVKLFVNVRKLITRVVKSFEWLLELSLGMNPDVSVSHLDQDSCIYSSPFNSFKKIFEKTSYISISPILVFSGITSRCSTYVRDRASIAYADCIHRIRQRFVAEVTPIVLHYLDKSHQILLEAYEASEVKNRKLDKKLADMDSRIDENKQAIQMPILGCNHFEEAPRRRLSKKLKKSIRAVSRPKRQGKTSMKSPDLNDCPRAVSLGVPFPVSGSPSSGRTSNRPFFSRVKSAFNFSKKG